MPRCEWAVSDAMVAYHDQEWGLPSHDDRHLFELLILEGAQAGLSWETILRKRAAYQEAYEGFDPERVATFDEARQELLLSNPGIVRNRAKIRASVINANSFLRVQQEFGSFDRYLWGFVGGKPKLNGWTQPGMIPAKTAESDDLSKDLLGRGFKFVGSTICYAYMQAVGLVNDHLVSCPRYREVQG